MNRPQIDVKTQKSVPSWLETPPTIISEPATVTRIQELPFERLTWENFERLCLRLVRLEGNVESCRLYGTKGQSQKGIDIFASQITSDKYRVYQCKRVDQFGPAKIRNAVSKFLDDDWANKSEIFTLCTKEDMRSTKRAEAIEEQRGLLRKRGIRLVFWDRSELSTRLKSHSQIVDDFFGRSWVEAFCGQAAAQKLGNRLDGAAVTELRKRLLAFYKATFNIHDPGLPLASFSEANILPLEERFVVPDITAWHSIILSGTESEDSEGMDDDIIKNRSFGSTIPASQYISKSYPTTGKIEERQSVDKWLSNSSKYIILGGPGSGKSSLLRFLAMDLLKEEPQIESLSHHWGKFLPIWVPFALWTKLIAKSESTSPSLSTLIHNWLESSDEGALWPLIQKALDDVRILLLVDGVDEWTSKSAAKIALDRLRVFIQQRNIPAIITSRPHGFELLGMQEMGWQQGQLSNFSRAQQKQLSRIWFAHWYKIQQSKGQIPHDVDLLKKSDTDNELFFEEIDNSTDLEQLAKVPLLLGLLIYHNFYNAQLPQSRFKAYKSLVEHLITKHPSRRKTIASITSEPSDFTDDEIQWILAHLAFHVHENVQNGMLSHEDVVDIVVNGLADENGKFGFPKHQARKESESIIELCTRNLGILVEGSPSDVRFYHRSFQEYLASLYLSSLPLEDQYAIVNNHCTDPQWREVILGFLYYMNRSEDIKRIVDLLQEKAHEVDIVQTNSINLLLCEISVGDFNCSASLARDLAKNAIGQIEYGNVIHQREFLLHQILDGLRSTKLKSLIISALTRWFPERYHWREYLFTAMAQWPATAETILCLWRGLHDENIKNQRAAAIALASFARDKPSLGDEVALLVKSTLSPTIRAAAIESLLQGWPGHDGLQSLLDNARKSVSPELRLIAIKGYIQAQVQSDEDRIELLQLGQWQGGVDYEWHDDVAAALMRGWPQSDEIKKICINALESYSHNGDRIENDIALRILLEGYPSDDEVAKYISNKIRNDKFPFSPQRTDSWHLIMTNFKNHPEMVSAIDDWMPTKEAFFEPDIAMAALVGRTSIAKNKLLSLLDGRFPHWAAGSLLEGWGMSDGEVAVQLKKIALGPIKSASRIGDFLPIIIENQTEAGSRLLEILQSPECARHDFVLAGLQALGNKMDVSKVVDIFEKIPIEHRSMINDMGVGQYISGFSSDNRVRKLALSELSRRGGSFAAVANAFSEDEEIRNRIIDIATPLPVRLRMVIAKRLGSKGMANTNTLTILQQYDHEHDSGVKAQASISFHRRLIASGNNLEPSISQLSEDIRSVGHDYKERRDAAFCGLLELNQLGLMEKAEETIGTKQPISISIDPWGSPNFPLIRQTLEHWNYLKETFHKDTWARLGGRHSDQITVVESICLLAHEYPDIAEEVFQFLESRGTQVYAGQILRFISKVRPKSQFLLECCLKSLGIGYTQSSHNWQDKILAAELMGKDFSGDQELLSKILFLEPIEPGFINETLILVLSEGWPDCSELDDIYRMLVNQKYPLPYREYFQILALKSTSKKIFEGLIEMISKPSSNSLLQIKSSTLPIIRRLGTDDSLLLIIMAHLQDNPTASEKASLARLASSARGVSPELQKWCMDELERQVNQENPPETGVDIISGRIRPVVNSLLDVVGFQKSWI